MIRHVSLAVSFGVLALALGGYAGCGSDEAPATEAPSDASVGTGGASGGGTGGAAGKGGSGGASGKGGSSGKDGSAGATGGKGGSGGSSGGSGAGSTGDGGSVGDDGGATGTTDASSGGSGGSDPLDAPASGDGACIGTDASYPGYPNFCDNGVRLMPPTGNSTVDALLNLTPLKCAQVVSDHSYAMDGEPTDPDNSPVQKLSDICAINGAVYWVADMDVDCDGKPTPGKCEDSADTSYQKNTAVQATGGGALEAAVTPYIVIPRDFNYPGIDDGTVVAVIYQDRIQYAIFGDTGPEDLIGEASYATAEKLGIYPSAIDGGAIGQVVTYIVFTGDNAVPNDNTNLDEIETLGAQLTDTLLANN